MKITRKYKVVSGIYTPYEVAQMEWKELIPLGILLLIAIFGAITGRIYL